MADRFDAKARIPTRPLSYDEHKELAMDKEILVDYKEHKVYIFVDGQFYDITIDIKNLITQITEEWKRDPTILQQFFSGTEGGDIIGDVKFTLPDGTEVTLEQSILQMLSQLEALKEQLGFVMDEQGNITKLEITVNNVKETEEKQFVSAEEKKNWDAKTTTNTLQVEVKQGSGNWTGSTSPYHQDIDIQGIQETDNPIVDVILSESYSTAMAELNSYAYIYKIITFNNSIRIYASSPTEVPLKLQMQINRPLNKLETA